MNIEPFIFLGFQKFFQQRDIPMYITCLDLEGVLVPEIWIAFSEVSGIPELRRTTRDEPDYDKLMRWRLGHSAASTAWACSEIQDVSSRRSTRCPAQRNFWTSCAAQTQAIILSDTFEEFAQPLMKKLGWPTIFCNTPRRSAGTAMIYRLHDALRAVQADDRPRAAVHRL